MIILAFDPGTGKNGTAYAVLHQVGGSVRYVTHGALPYGASAEVIAALAREHAPSVVAVEGVAPYMAGPERVAGVIPLAVEVGRLTGVLQRCGYTVFSLPANAASGPNWRGHLTRNRRAGDAEVKRAVQAIVTNLPKRTNAHARDAMGLGIVAGSHARYEPNGG